MHARTRRFGIVIVAGLLVAGPAVFAQDKPNADARMDQFERRLDEMERRHQAELKARDEEIARLKALVEKGTGGAAPPASKPAADQGPQDLIGEIERAGTPAAAGTATGKQVVRDAESRDALTLKPRTPVSFNPDLAVVGLFQGNVSTNNDNPARNRFDIGSVELDLRAAVDPRADGVVVLPIARDVEDPLFFRKGPDTSGEVGTEIEIEEAYLFLHDFGVPNLTAKLGRFHLRFGRQNILHAHDWPTTDNNFVNQSFLGPEAISDAGLSLSYVIPPKLLGGQYVEVIAEIVSGEGEGPVVNNDALVDSPALNVHVLWNHDFGDWNLEVGGSYYTGKHDNDNQLNVNLFGADLTLLHTDPTGRFNNQLFQAEAIYGDVDTTRTDTQHAFGAYVLGQQQINRDFYAGVRLDWTKDATDDRQEIWGVSPYLTWYWSEFLRFRMEYQHRGGDVKEEDTLYFQVVFVYGAHPPHPYWALR
jgi:hypothetical protein